MGREHREITPKIRDFIEAQKMFFVATAPLSGSGLLNLSPKGLDGSLRVLDEKRIAYFELSGSGVETIAHLKQNGRIVLMFCAFEGKGQRDTLLKWSEKRGDDGAREYRQERNRLSLDGLTGFESDA